MALDLTFINAALTRIGDPTITTLNDGTPGSNIAGQNYDLIVRTVLTGYPWRFATKTATLAALTGEPDPPWLYAYQLPSDLRMLRAVTVGGSPIRYEQQFNKLLCDYGTSTDVLVTYTWDVPEDYWPPDFAEVITQFLEALLLRGVGERHKEAAEREQSARALLQAARTNDSKRAAPRDPWRHPTLEARLGTALYEPLSWR